MTPTNIGWQPICEKRLPYELTVSLLLEPENPGFPIPLKLQEQHKPLFLPDRIISDVSGRLIREWASGGKQIDPVSILDRIDGAKNIDELKAIGMEIVGLSLSHNDKADARAKYRARLDELNAQYSIDNTDDEDPTLCAKVDCKRPSGDGVFCEAHR